MALPFRIYSGKYLLCFGFSLLIGTVWAQNEPVVFKLPAEATVDIPMDTTSDVVGDHFFHGINKTTDKTWVMRQLSDMVISSPKTGRWFSDSVQVVDRMKYFRLFEGNTIRSLRFLRLDPFGTTINDTIQHPLTWIEQTGNSVRTRTREQKIRNYTLFKSGDQVNAFRFLDTEELLRALDYLEDARIYIQQVPEKSGLVDVVVVTHDVWPIALDFDVPHLNSGKLNIWHRNLFGLGLNVEQGIYWQPSKTQQFGYLGAIGLDNLFQSLIDAKVHYIQQFKRSAYGVMIMRDFLIPSIKYGGYIAYQKEKVEVDDYFEGVLLGPRDNVYTTVGYSTADVWLARSFSLPNHPSFPESRRNITLSARVYGLSFKERPLDLVKDYYPLQNKTLYLGSLAYTKQRSHLTQLLYSFGRSEDVPSGRSAELVWGQEIYEKSDRFYLGGRMAGGRFIGQLGYIYGDVAYGLFFNGSGSQGTWKMSWNYFTPLLKARRYQSRTFFSGSYTYGFRSSTFEYLTLNGKQGIAGFSNDSLRGNQRLLLHWETNLFMPKKLYGFRFVFFTSGNFGWINNSSDHFILSAKMYSSLGIGIRIRNDHLVFSTFQFRFSWFPSMPRGSRLDWFQFSTADKLRLPQFRPVAPEAIWLN